MYPYDALYARQSLDKRDSLSIESQLDFCKYETHGNAFETYIDRGFSGKNTSRPAFEDMMKDIRTGKIKRVIVYKLDRISRSILDFSNMMEVFQKYHVEFVSATEKFDTSTPIGRAMLNICIVFAQLERETIQKRVADAYYTKSRRGYYMGGRIPYGFQLEKKIADSGYASCFIPFPEEVEQIQWIYKLYAAPDMTLGAILRKLSAKGMIQKRGATWCTARLSEIIRNPVYVKADVDVYNFFLSQGAYIVNPVQDFIGMNGLFLYKRQSDENCDVVIAPHKGVIDSELWLKCRRKLMNNRQAARTNKGKRTWLTGKMKCKKCGYAYIVTTANTKAGRYFQCSGSRYAVKCKGAGQTIYAEILEEGVLCEMKKKLGEFQFLSERQMQDTPSLPMYQMQIAKIDKEINSLMGKVGDANHILMQYINRKMEELDNEKQKMNEAVMGVTGSYKNKNTEKITNHLQLWEKLCPEDKQQIADILIKVIHIGEGEIEIEWNI